MDNAVREVPREAYAKFQDLRATYTQLAQKIAELDAERGEHETVLKALEPLDKDRRCFRLIGGVLVERTVGEVAPAVQSNRDNITAVVEKMLFRLAEIEKEMNEVGLKHGLLKTDPSEQRKQNDREASEKDSSSKQSSGLLV